MAVAFCFAFNSAAFGANCTSNTLPSGGCTCTSSYHPTGCTCASDYHPNNCVCSSAYAACSTSSTASCTPPIITLTANSSASAMPSSNPLIITFNNVVSNNVGSTISFTLSAKGTFYIDWNNTTYSKITRTDTVPRIYRYQYANVSGLKNIKIYGPATAYNTTWPAITFSSEYTLWCATGSAYNTPNFIVAASGCLGCVFPTLGSGTSNQPSFRGTFALTRSWGNNPNLASGMPPADFFSGIYGTPISYQCAYMFYGALNFGRGPLNAQSELPPEWFQNMSGCATNVLLGAFDNSYVDPS